MRLNPVGQDLPDEEVGAAAHMVIVQEDHHEADIVALRFRLFDIVGGDGARRRVTRIGLAGDADEAKRFDALRLAVFRELEVTGRQIRDGVAFPVGDDRVDPHEVDAGTKGRLRGARLLLLAAFAALLLRLGWCRRRGWLFGLPGRWPLLGRRRLPALAVRCITRRRPGGLGAVMQHLDGASAREDARRPGGHESLA
jgi:hypothetical protein